MIFRYFRNFSRFDVLSKYGRRFSKFSEKLNWTVELVQKIIKFDNLGVQSMIGTFLSKCHHPCPSLVKVSNYQRRIKISRSFTWCGQILCELFHFHTIVAYLKR